MYKFGPVQRRILIILLGGVALGMSSNPRQYQRVFRVIKKDWNRFDRASLKRSLNRLSDQKLVKEELGEDGSCRMVLTEEGRRQAKRLSLIGGSIKFKKLKKWDRKWRIVLFDIPEESRVFRNILRAHLKELGFLKLQQSVFVLPYSVEDAILELVRLYSAEKYVRVITATRIDNQKELKKYFFGKNKSVT
ncbi:CRISPR-associated endonuclease Cas2 [Patescibacteria group bacterium]